MPKRVEKVRTNLYLPKSLVDRIDVEAEQMGTSRSGIITQRMNQFYFEMDSQTQMNKGIDILAGIDNKEVVKQVLMSFLENQK